jgi:hypothetical protein
MGRKCNEINCNTQAIFSSDEGKNRYCSKHKTPDMIDIVNRRCEFENCNSQPNFDIKGGKGKLCVKHKTSEMIDVKHKTCIYKDCNIRPSYNIIGKSPLYCVSHKTKDMIDLTKERCNFKECNIIGTFNIKGKKEKYCKIHKTYEMIDENRKKCSYLDCKKRPVYGLELGKAIYCIKHKTSNMIDVISHRCLYKDCLKQPSFGKVGDKIEYCKIHKTLEMINLKNKKCEYEDCTTIPVYGEIKGTPAKFCVKHKTDKMFDVTSNICVLCSTRASYGKPGNKMIRCFQHREIGMIRRSNGKCKVCKNPAIFGTNFIPLYCETHKTEYDTNLVEIPCESCNLVMILDKNNKCEYCNPEIFKSARLAKQNALMDYLDNRGLVGTTTDTIIDGGICGKERPDRVYETDSFILILECDENQHKDRLVECEKNRMINITQSYGGMPLYFIRWNPDDYISDKLPEQLKRRYNLLGDFIESILHQKITLPNNLANVIYMYYDGWTSLNNENWKSLIEYN